MGTSLVGIFWGGFSRGEGGGGLMGGNFPGGRFPDVFISIQIHRSESKT